ncbi:MAG: c-type cytochrome, partial [Acetobacteraceae bacterium]
AYTLGPMAEVVHESLQYASAADLQAMAAYLKSLPVAASPARDTGGMFRIALDATRAELDEGRTLYGKHCAGCHGNDGGGRLPAAPPLAGDRAVTMTADVDPIRIVLFGGYPPGTAGNPRPFGMPPFYPTLRDDQIAAVLTYVRASWGNDAPPVLTSHVEANRGSPLW